MRSYIENYIDGLTPEERAEFDRIGEEVAEEERIAKALRLRDVDISAAMSADPAPGSRPRRVPCAVCGGRGWFDNGPLDQFRCGGGCDEFGMLTPVTEESE